MLETLGVSIVLFLLLVVVGIFFLRTWQGAKYRLLIASALFALALPVFYLSAYITRYYCCSQTSDKTLSLADGVKYIRRHHHGAVVHQVKILINRVDIQVTRPQERVPSNDNLAMLTTEAVQGYRADFGINASFFTPFSDTHLFDYYPRRGDPVVPVGQTIAEGVLHGKFNLKWPKVLFYENGSIDISLEVIEQSDIHRSRIAHAISGRRLLLERGETLEYEDKSMYPRTAIGIDKNKENLWLFVVDGKQPGYSRGLSLENLAVLMQSQGVWNAVELDGGGSATMALRDDNGNIRLLSRPSHTKIPNRERPVANHLLITYKK